jgi:3,4-dihydroxy-9,10-secoandrosta-1,3,5(10)-triene-9,17-dione 4,5-dioxygenase
MSGFVTGEGYGMGHVALHSKDSEASAQWYCDMLGFALSDYVIWQADVEAHATFLHCNKRQHALAIVNECLGNQGGTFNHLMLEVDELEDVGRAFDIVQEQNYPVGMNMGQHTNDKTTSFYLWSPCGDFMVECGWGGVDLDHDSWKTEYYDAVSRWGHHFQPFPES